MLFLWCFLPFRLVHMHISSLYLHPLSLLYTHSLSLSLSLPHTVHHSACTRFSQCPSVWVDQGRLCPHHYASTGHKWLSLQQRRECNKLWKLSIEHSCQQSAEYQQGLLQQQKLQELKQHQWKVQMNKNLNCYLRLNVFMLNLM